MTRVLAAAAVAAFLSGCHPALRPTVPTSLLTCSDAPAWRKGGTQRDVAAHIVDFRDAHADCRDRLGAVRGLVGGKP